MYSHPKQMVKGGERGGATWEGVELTFCQAHDPNTYCYSLYMLVPGSGGARACVVRVCRIQVLPQQL